MMSSRFRILAAALCLVLVATACGSRRDRSELLAVGNAGSTIVDAGFVTVDGNQVSQGEDASTPLDSATPGEAAASTGGGDGAGDGSAAPADDVAPTGDQTQATTPAATGGGQSRGAAVANKKPIVIGTVATISGPVGAFVKDSVTAIQLWVQDVNSRGGLNGHPVEYIVADDGGDPSRYQALQRQLVEEKGAVAFLFNTLGFGAAGNTTYNQDKRVPILGHEGGTEAGYDNPMVFTATSAGKNYAFSLINGLADIIKPKGVKKIAVLACSDVKLCDIFFNNWTGEGAKRNGFEVVYTARPSLTQPDYTSECLGAKQKGAEAIIAAVDNNSYIRLGNACNRQSYEPIIGIADQLALPSVARADSLQGSVVAGRLAPWPANDKPGLVELKQAFAKFAPGTEVNGAHVGGWVYAKLLEAAARNLPDDPTNEDILKGLWSIRNNDLGGITYPLTFTEGQGSPRKTCWSSVVIKDKKFVAPFGGRLTCL